MNKKEKLLFYLRMAEKPPTVDEMKKILDTRSTRAVYQILEDLESDGLISRKKIRPRNIELAEDLNIRYDRLVEIPLLGNVAAGEPIEAIEYIENIAVPVEMLGKRGEYFALRATGDSMQDVNILDGDKVIIEKSPEAANGDIVVALIDNENATLKKFYQNGQTVSLVPANKNFDTLEIEAERVMVQGRFIGLMRSENWK